MVATRPSKSLKDLQELQHFLIDLLSSLNEVYDLQALSIDTFQMISSFFLSYFSTSIFLLFSLSIFKEPL